MEEPRRLRDATLIRIRQLGRSGRAGLPVAHEKGRDLNACSRSIFATTARIARISAKSCELPTIPFRVYLNFPDRPICRRDLLGDIIAVDERHLKLAFTREVKLS